LDTLYTKMRDRPLHKDNEEQPVSLRGALSRKPRDANVYYTHEPRLHEPYPDTLKQRSSERRTRARACLRLSRAYWSQNLLLSSSRASSSRSLYPEMSCQTNSSRSLGIGASSGLSVSPAFISVRMLEMS